MITPAERRPYRTELLYSDALINHFHKDEKMPLILSACWHFKDTSCIKINGIFIKLNFHSL